jgi:hypothetical protein
LKIKLQGRHFDTTEVIEAVLNTFTEQLSVCIKKWQKRWERDICAEGTYFEGNSGQ